MIKKALAAACRQTQAIVADYTIEPLYPVEGRPKPGHRWLVEFDRAPADPAAFMAAVDASIRGESEDYDTHRQKQLRLDPPVLLPMASRTFYQWMKQKANSAASTRCRAWPERPKWPRSCWTFPEVRTLRVKLISNRAGYLDLLFGSGSPGLGQANK